MEEPLSMSNMDGRDSTTRRSVIGGFSEVESDRYVLVTTRNPRFPVELSGRVGAARRNAVAAAIRGVAQIRSAAHDAMRPPVRSGRIATRAVRSSSPGRTNRSTTPTRCRSCCRGRSHSVDSCPPAPYRPSRPWPSSPQGNVPWNTFIRCSPLGSSSSPHGNTGDSSPPAAAYSHSASVGRRVPLH